MTGKTILDLLQASLSFFRSALQFALGNGPGPLALLSRVSRAVMCRDEL